MGSYKSSTMVWFTAFLLLGILGVLLILDMHFEHDKRTVREQEKLATQANVIVANASHQLMAIDNVLKQLQQDLGVLRKDPAGFNRELSALASAMPGVRSIGVLDAEGTLLYASRPQNIGQNFSYRDYFQTIKADPNPGRLFISRPFTTTSGIWLITIGKMLTSPNGSFSGVVVAAFNPDYFKTLMQSVLYAPDMWASITHGDGHIFVMVPERATVLGNSLMVPASLFSRHIASHQPTTLLTGQSFSTGEQSMMVQTTLNPPDLRMDKPLVIAVSRDLEKIYAPWYEELKVKLGLYLMLIVIAISGIYDYQNRNKQYETMVKETKAALQLSEDNYRVIVENTSELIIKVDPEGFYTYVNPAFCTLYKASPEELIGRHYSQDVFEEDQPIVKEFFEKLLQPPYSVSFIHRENTSYGIRYLEWRGRAVHDEGGKIKELVGVARDVTERVESMGRLREQAQTDYLTGIANRRYFMEQGELELERAKRYIKPLSIFMIDIDYFKKINDTYGHKFGDLVLQKLSAKLSEILRGIDIIGRIGGEEFAVLLPETELHEAAEVAERLRDSVARTSVPREEGMPVNFTISIGVAALNGSDIKLEGLLSKADKAMYEAKQSGRNKVNVAS